MPGERYIYQGDVIRWLQEPRLTSQMIQELVLRGAREIRSLYDAGTPFFTKESLLQVSAQLEAAPQQGQSINIMAVNGQVIPFEIETGRVRDHESDHRLEYVIGEPFIDYLSVQELVDCNRQPISNWYTPRIAYCNQLLFHRVHLRSKETGKFVDHGLTETPEQIREKLEQFRLAMRSVEPMKSLRSLLFSKSTPNVHRIIGFAFGTMNGDRHAQSWIERSCFQHAMLLWLRDLLCAKQGHRIPCWVQDPSYTASDKTVLLDHNVSVADSPDGFIHVDDDSLVLSFGAEVPVHQIIAAIATPAILIWEKFSYEHEAAVMIGTTLDQDCPRLREIYAQSYDLFDLDCDPRISKRTAVFVKRDSS